jgi:hypothetical protein
MLRATSTKCTESVPSDDRDMVPAHGKKNDDSTAPLM